MKKITVCLTVALFCTPASRAVEKSGSTLEIPADLLGVSGTINRKTVNTDSTAALTSTFGWFSGGQRMLSPSFTEVWPGLWGGSPAVQGKGTVVLLSYGDPAFPVTLKIPPGAFPSDFTVFVSQDPLSKPMYASPAAITSANTQLTKALTKFTRPLNGQMWEFVAMDGEGNRYTDNFQEDAILTFYYSDNNNDGVIDDTTPPVRAANLRVWWLDEKHNLWVKLPGGTVDPAAKTVAVPIRHFSVFAAMGVPSFAVGDAFAFPVPWRPNGGMAGSGAGQTGTLADGVTFTNLPSLCKIRIYSVTGQLVREIDHDDGTPQHTWNVKNDDAEDVATGTYLYVIESNGSRKSGKLAVIR